MAFDSVVGFFSIIFLPKANYLNVSNSNATNSESKNISLFQNH